jgi:hypothetical protein
VLFSAISKLIDINNGFFHEVSLGSFVTDKEKIGLASKASFNASSVFIPCLRAVERYPRISTKNFCSMLAPEAPRYFLLYFCHPNIALTLIIGKRHRKIMHECKRFLFIFFQPIPKVHRWVPFFSASLA